MSQRKPPKEQPPDSISENNTPSLSQQSHAAVEWTIHHEKILIDWADKATCYKWLHEKSQREFSRKSRWFTIPVIIMSTITGTANFAQDRIPPEYLNMATMIIGGVNLIAGVVTTIQQFLKINELNESHRVSAISWGKFQRNLQVELSKPPSERTQALHLIKVAKEEYDRLIETSNSIPNHIIKEFRATFSGGEITYNAKNEMIPLTDKQKIFAELSKPAICDAIESVKRTIYTETSEDIELRRRIQYNVGVDNRVKSLQEQQAALVQSEYKQIYNKFIAEFTEQYKRLPTATEILNNMDSVIPSSVIETFIGDNINDDDGINNDKNDSSV